VCLCCRCGNGLAISRHRNDDDNEEEEEDDDDDDNNNNYNNNNYYYYYYTMCLIFVGVFTEYSRYLGLF